MYDIGSVFGCLFVCVLVLGVTGFVCLYPVWVDLQVAYTGFQISTDVCLSVCLSLCLFVYHPSPDAGTSVPKEISEEECQGVIKFILDFRL